MDWTLTAIKAKVRKLSGRPSTAQLSDADLLNFINNFYRNSFPLLLDTKELEDWYTKTLSIGVSDYTLDEDYLNLDPPFTIDGATIDFYENPTLFYKLWPETQTYTNAKPSDVLLYDRKLTFRPPPDLATYVFKAACIKKPTAFAGADDKPPNQNWGPVVSYGAAIDIYMDNGEISEANGLNSGFAFFLGIVNKHHKKYLTGVRSIPHY